MGCWRYALADLLSTGRLQAKTLLEVLWAAESKLAASQQPRKPTPVKTQPPSCLVKEGQPDAAGDDGQKR